MKMLKMVFFDVGGTLLYTKNSHEVVFKNCFEKFGINIKLQEIASAVENVLSVHPKERLSFTDEQKNMEWWLTFYRLVLNILNVKDEADKMVKMLWNDHSIGENLSIFSDTVETLSHLKNDGLKLGIISNWDKTLHFMLNKFKIKSFFELIFISCEVGYEKPDLRFFTYVLEKSGFKPEETFYVGDDYYKDFIPSKKAGMNPVYLCHIEAYPDAVCPPEHPRNLRDVEKIIHCMRLK